MSSFADVQSQYDKDKKLKKEDVQALLDWANKQQHLPKINELQAIIFLHNCNYSNEKAKTVLDNFYTMKTLSPELFQTKNFPNNALDTIMNHIVLTPLPKKTPQGSTIFILKFVDPNSDNFNLSGLMKYMDMVLTLHIYQEGICDGHVMLVDLEKFTLGHIPKIGPFVLKKLIVYFQETMFFGVKEVHFYNIVSFFDKIISLVRPFAKSEVIDILHIHNTLESLAKSVPLECLPEDYGGSIESVSILQEKIKRKLGENRALFEWEETLTVDESKRVGKPKIVDDFYGIDGTFKKLEID